MIVLKPGRAFKAFFKLVKKLSFKENVVVGVCGGRSVVEFYKDVVRNKNNISKNIWRKINFFFVDERVVSKNSEESNYKLVLENLFKGLIKAKLVSWKQVHRFRAERDIKLELKNYTNLFNRFGGGFDIIVLSSGEDGHVASLFPGYRLLMGKGKRYLYLEDSPKAPARRITVSSDLIKDAKSGLMFFVGEGKREAYRKFKNPKVRVWDCPAKLARKIRELYVVRDLE